MEWKRATVHKWIRHTMLGGAALLLLCVIYCIGMQAAQAAYFPEASGKKTKKDNSVTVDYSNANDGYVMIKHKGSKKKLKVIITCGDKKDTFDLNGNGDFDVYPLMYGSGTYTIQVWQNTSTKAGSTSYSSLMSFKVKAKIDDPNIAFLYPNNVAWYTAQSPAIQKAQELCAGLRTDEEKLQAIYEYVSNAIVYDYIKAVTVQAGYVPDVDKTFTSGTGICFDYSALMACMLRTQGIPTRLAIGDLTAPGAAQDHAWNVVYVGGKWVLRDATLATKNYKVSYYITEKYR